MKVYNIRLVECESGFAGHGNSGSFLIVLMESEVMVGLATGKFPVNLVERSFRHLAIERLTNKLIIKLCGQIEIIINFAASHILCMDYF